jgi:endoglucanase
MFRNRSDLKVLTRVGDRQLGGHSLGSATAAEAGVEHAYCKPRKVNMLARTSLCRVAALVSSLLVVACSMHAAAAQQVTVSGNAFIKDGAKWVPQGFSLVGLVAPKGHEMGGGFERARSLYGPQLFERARSLGANTLRIQVSQPGLDPQSPIFDPGYTQEAVDAVRQARAAGFVVIVSMQWEEPAGLAGLPNMPGDSTLRAWSRIAGAFAADGGVMLELFNEPKMQENNPDTWPT